MIIPNFRSVLITPALKVDLYTKGSSCGADIFMLDFEDSIPLNQKNESRALFLKNKNKIGCNKYCFRINSIHSKEGLQDLLFLIDNKIQINYLLVSKITHGHELLLIKNLFQSANLPTPRLISLIENSAAITNIDGIAQLSDALLFGSADYSLGYGLLINSPLLAYAKHTVALYANKYQIPAIDAPTFTMDDLKSLSIDCIESRNIGFCGKLAISKNQVPIINDLYQYNEEEINWAKTILNNKPGDSSIARINKNMVGTPFYKLAQQINQSTKRDKRHAA